MNNNTQFSDSNVHYDTTPLTPVKPLAHGPCWEDAEGAVHRFNIFVRHSLLEKSTTILGKACRWRIARYTAKKVLDGLLQVCYAGLRVYHVAYPQVVYRCSLRSLKFPTNVRVGAPAVASPNSKKVVVAGCISLLVRLILFVGVEPRYQSHSDLKEELTSVLE